MLRLTSQEALKRARTQKEQRRQKTASTPRCSRCPNLIAYDLQQAGFNVCRRCKESDDRRDSELEGMVRQMKEDDDAETYMRRRQVEAIVALVKNHDERLIDDLYVAFNVPREE